MALADLTRASVDSALAEYDLIGSDAFLAKYGFGKARRYFLVVGGKEYHSKAVAGAAHGFLSASSQPLRAVDFSGGENTVAHTLRSLGYEVRSEDADTRNPKWIRDELILALDLYWKNPASPPGKNSTAMGDLSAQLNQLASMLGRGGDAEFRNRNGVYMKVMNFRRFDPSFTSVGKSGLSHGSKDDETVWNEFASDRARLASVAAAIVAAISAGTTALAEADLEDGIEEAEEGRLLTFLHRRRERSRKLVEARKRKALAETDELRCEACDLSFAERYGSHGDGFIEVHHTRPLHTLREGDKTALRDLALVCANCHRMIHRKSDWLSVEQLKALMDGQRMSKSQPTIN